MHDHMGIATLLGPDWLDAYGIVLSLFLVGLIGSATHCVGMCGPFVLGQVANRLDRSDPMALNEWGRLRAAALLPYQFGRMTVYVGLGAFAGAFSQAFLRLTGYHWVLGVFLAAGAIMLVLAAFGRSIPGLRLPGTGGRRSWGLPFVNLLQPLFADPRGVKGYLLGLALGFLPCGLLYAAVAIAASAGQPLLAAAGMAAFAVGTMPMLIATGFVGATLANRWRGLLRVAVTPLLCFNAAVLVFLAVRSLA